MKKKPIGIASDHAGFALKQYVKEYLDAHGLKYKDYGTLTEDSCDYSDFGHALAEGIEKGEVFPGIGICGSGEGIAMTLNKHQDIRAGLAWTPMCLSCQEGLSTTTPQKALWTSSSTLSLKADGMSDE